MKTIEIKKGNKTTIKIVPDNYQEEDNFRCKDISVNGGYIKLMEKEDYDRIFGNKETLLENKDESM